MARTRERGFMYIILKCIIPERSTYDVVVKYESVKIFPSVEMRVRAIAKAKRGHFALCAFLCNYYRLGMRIL